MEEHTAKSVYAQNDLEAEFFKMMCPEGGNVQTFLIDLHYKHKELAAALAKKNTPCHALQDFYLADALPHQ